MLFLEQNQSTQREEVSTFQSNSQAARERTKSWVLSKTFTLIQDSLPKRQSCYGSYRLATEGGSRELLVCMVEKGQARRFKKKSQQRREVGRRVRKPPSEGNEGAERLSRWL